MSIKFRVLGGGILVFFGGGKCKFYFYGLEDFSDDMGCPKKSGRDTKASRSAHLRQLHFHHVPEDVGMQHHNVCLPCCHSLADVAPQARLHADTKLHRKESRL